MPKIKTCTFRKSLPPLVMIVFMACLLAPSWGRAAASETPPLSFTAPDASSIYLSAKPKLSLKKMCVLTLTVTKGSPWIPVAFDALMPSHGHGMVVQATPPRALADSGQYEIKGVKLHMSGAWLLKLKIRHRVSGEEKWLEQTLLLNP